MKIDLHAVAFDIDQCAIFFNASIHKVAGFVLTLQPALNSLRDDWDVVGMNQSCGIDFIDDFFRSIAKHLRKAWINVRDFGALEDADAHHRLFGELPEFLLTLLQQLFGAFLFGDIHHGGHQVKRFAVEVPTARRN